MRKITVFSEPASIRIYQPYFGLRSLEEDHGLYDRIVEDVNLASDSMFKETDYCVSDWDVIVVPFLNTYVVVVDTRLENLPNGWLGGNKGNACFLSSNGGITALAHELSHALHFLQVNAQEGYGHEYIARLSENVFSITHALMGELSFTNIATHYQR